MTKVFSSRSLLNKITANNIVLAWCLLQMTECQLETPQASNLMSLLLRVAFVKVNLIIEGTIFDSNSKMKK